MTGLLFVMYASLAILLVTSLMIIVKRGGKKNEIISLIATLSMSVATIVVGISTVNATKRTETMEKQLNQPLFTVKINPSYSVEKSIFDNEEFIIANEGAKTKIKTDVNVHSIIEIEYHDTKNKKNRIIKNIPVIYFDGATFTTNNLDGVIEYSNYSGNNKECFCKLHQDALQYEAKHPGIYVTVQIKHYFSLYYVDIYGEKHHIVKTEENEIDPDEFTKMQSEAQQNIKGFPRSVKCLTLDKLMALLFEEK